jgi:hypothetical protein
MITAEIKIHEEPKPYSPPQVYTSYTLMSQIQKQVFEANHELELEAAKKIYQIGDFVKLTARDQQVQITGFVEDPSKVILYEQKMCVIYAEFVGHPTNNSLRYAIHELKEDTLIRSEQLPLLPNGANDGLC